MSAAIATIDYYLPSHRLTNDELAKQFPEWSQKKIETKLGIAERRIALEDECSSDLGIAAAEKVFRTGICKPSDVDYILFCTQSPDYFLPTTACVMQQRLGIPNSAGALDFNLGCSGFVYGVGLAKALIETGQAANVLLITGETYSKFINRNDRSVRTLFGDAGTATLVRHMPGNEEFLGPFVYGTDGRGAPNLIVPTGGMRRGPAHVLSDHSTRLDNDLQIRPELYMNGAEIFAFTLEAVPSVVEQLLARTGNSIDDIDLYVFHQANQYILEHLRKKLRIPSERFVTALRHTGNTVSCTIPIAVKHALDQGRIRAGNLIMLVGFGVGYSWGAMLLRWV